MKTVAYFPSKYIQGAGVINELPTLINLFGKKGLLLASPTAKRILPDYCDSSAIEQIQIEVFNGESCEEEIRRVIRLIEENNIDVLIGMGGGKTIDTAKIAADRKNIPSIIVPTIASTDAPCSGCAIIYTKEGVFVEVEYQKTNPAAVLVDLNIITNSPVRFLVAGMGDALATWFEAQSCERTQSLNECHGLSTRAGFNMASLCYDTLLKYGILAKKANEGQIVTPALSHIVEANILLSGIGFESCGLAAAHSVHNGLTALEETHRYYHGEKVAFGTLTGLHLTGADPEEIETVYEFCEAVGLPTTFAELGLENINKEQLKIVAEKSCEKNSYIFHEAGEITPQKVIDAMIMADITGKSRKNI